jgi:hypothetical protein
MTQPPDPRAELLALLAARPTVAGLRPPSLLSANPLRPLSPALAAIAAARVQAGLTPTGSEYPRRERWQRPIVPSVAIAIIAALVAIIAALISHSKLALIATAVVVVCIIIVIVAGRYVMADPLRLGRAHRLELLNAGHWDSTQSWVPPATAGPERTLVDLAVAAVGQIANSPAWLPPNQSPDRPPMVLAADLDQIDAQARQIAAIRATNPNDPGATQAWDALLDRVVALRGYAGQLAAQQARAPLGYQAPEPT